MTVNINTKLVKLGHKCPVKDNARKIDKKKYQVRNRNVPTKM